MKLSGSDDSRVMGEVSAGNVEAFGELYDRFCNRAYGVALSVCRDEGSAQDAVQEAFLSVWKSRETYRPERAPVAAWLLTVVRYRAIDLARRNDSRAAPPANEDQVDVGSPSEDVSERVIQREDADGLLASLAMLPEEQREVISLAYFGQLSHTEIAAQLGLPSGTVKGRMRLGLQKLRADVKRSAA